MGVIEIGQTLEHGKSDLANDFDRYGTQFFVDPVQTTLIHIFHAYAYMRVCHERAVKRYDVWRVTVMHDLELAQDLLPHRRLRVNQHNL